MPPFRMKKISVFTAVFVTAFIFSDFLLLAAIIVGLFSYLLAIRPPSAAAVKVSGIPALLAVFLIASISTITLSDFPFSAWDFGKDIYFFIAPVLLLFLGLMLFKSGKDFINVAQIAIYVLTLSSLIIYFNFLVGGGIANVSLESRYANALNSSASTLALLLIASLHPTVPSLLRDKTATLFLVFNLLLVIVSLSRVEIATALISLFFVYTNRSWAQRLTILAVLLLIMTPLMPLEQPDTMSIRLGNATFYDKALGSFDELRISDYSTMSSINQNWRGYEANLGVLEVERIGLIAYFIGVGFGSYVVGPFEDKLTHIPFFHNGFVTIFFKAGFLGLGAFIFFIFKLFRLTGVAGSTSCKNDNSNIKRASIMIYVMTISLLLKTISVHGIYYSKTSLELLFIALAICSLQIEKRNFGSNRYLDAQNKRLY